MAQRIPNFMKTYMDNIGYESHPEYEWLSKEYYEAIAYYNERTYPKRNENWNMTHNTQYDSERDLHYIDERYKSKALDVACKYGYEKPSEEKLMEDGYIAPEFEDVSWEDARASYAHRVFTETQERLRELEDQDKEHQPPKEEQSREFKYEDWFANSLSIGRDDKEKAAEREIEEPEKDDKDELPTDNLNYFQRSLRYNIIKDDPDPDKGLDLDRD